MGKHSSGGGSPFNRKHQHLGHTQARRGRSLLTLDSGNKGSGPRLSDPKSRRTGALESAPARLKSEREHRRRRIKTVAMASLVTIGVLLVVCVGAAFGYVKWLEKTMAPEEITKKLSPSLDKSTAQKPFNVLVIGADKRKNDTVSRADTMIFARVDPKAKKVWLLSIPRDTRAEIMGQGAAKINQAYAYGGPEGAIEAAKDLTGLPVHHYIQVDFLGFVKAVDALGGVWIDVPVEIDDYDASSHSYKHRAQHIDAGYQLLDGEHALTFARARHQFIDQDFARMKNQQLFFKALADQVARPENLTRLPKIVSAVAPHVKTDMKLMGLIRTAQALRDAGAKNVYTATVPGEWRNPYVWTDEEELEELIAKMNAGMSFDATGTPEPRSQEGGDARRPSQITVTVRNGAGIAGCAKQASSILKAQAFKVGEVGNANQFVYDKTLVVYKSDRAAAELVAKTLPPGARVVESRGMYAFASDVLVVIGKDWDLAKVPITPVRTN